jgi:Na+-translocating ferredoxin:NAD+ oxidoreductase RnfD subunit
VTAEAIQLQDALRPLRRFFRTPKGLLLAVFALMGVVAVDAAGVGTVLPNLLIATGVCAALDIAIVYLRTDEVIFPDGALLTGLIIAFVLRPQEPVAVVASTAGIAMITKHTIRTRWSNVFNPAAIALVLSGLLFSAGQSWWGALPQSGVVGLALLLAGGLFMTDRINKLPLVLAFLAAYFLLFTEASFLLSDGMRVAEIFRSPDLQAVLFFALFMLDDPPTCPVPYGAQIAFGIGAAVVAYLVFLTWGVDYYLAAGLVVANVLESARRIVAHNGLRLWQGNESSQIQPHKNAKAVAVRPVHPNRYRQPVRAGIHDQRRPR